MFERAACTVASVDRVVAEHKQFYKIPNVSEFKSPLADEILQVSLYLWLRAFESHANKMYVCFLMRMEASYCGG